MALCHRPVSFAAMMPVLSSQGVGRHSVVALPAECGGFASTAGVTERQWGWQSRGSSYSSYSE